MEKLTARKLLLTSLWVLIAAQTYASESLIDEPDGAAYHYVSHHSIEIPVAANEVWPHLADLGSWMYDFELLPLSGEAALEGRVFRLYEGQEFYVQVVKAIPGRLLVMANLPSSMEGEMSTGSGVTTLVENDGVTQVDLTMIRRYTWTRPGENPMKLRRQSEAFNESTQAMWQRFLERLAELSTREASWIRLREEGED